jgi:hypothetical protein
MITLLRLRSQEAYGEKLPAEACTLEAFREWATPLQVIMLMMA